MADLSSQYNSLADLIAKQSFLEGGGGEKSSLDKINTIIGTVGQMKTDWDARVQQKLENAKKELENKKLAREQQMVNIPLGVIAPDTAEIAQKNIESKPVSNYTSMNAPEALELQSIRDNIMKVPEGSPAYNSLVKQFEQKSLELKNRLAGQDVLQKQREEDALKLGQEVEKRKGIMESQGLPPDFQGTVGQAKDIQTMGTNVQKSQIYWQNPDDPNDIQEIKDSKHTRPVKVGTPLKEEKPLQGSLGVIGSKMVSWEYAKEMFPELKPGQDIPKTEWDARIRMKAADTSANAPKPMASDQIDKITLVRNGIDTGNVIKGKLFDLVAKGKSPVDPVSGRWQDLKNSIGIQTDEEVASFQADAVAQLSNYLNSISGAAITEAEAGRLMKRLPRETMTMQQFLGRMDSFDQELKRALSNRISSLKDAGFRVGDLDRFIIKKEEPSANPIGTTRDLNSYLNDNKIPIELRNKAKAALNKKIDEATVLKALKQDAGIK